MIVPGGGLSLDNERWVAARSNFLVHVNVLARLFRGKMLAMLIHGHAADELKFFDTHAGLADKPTFKRFIAPLRRIKWVVYCKRPFAGPVQVLRYLFHYTHRVAISNRRLVAADNAAIAFRWKDYRADGPARWKTMRLHPHEFIRLKTAKAARPRRAGGGAGARRRGDRMRRREFIAGLGAAAWPLPVHAQQGERLRRIRVAPAMLC